MPCASGPLLKPRATNVENGPPTSNGRNAALKCKGEKATLVVFWKFANDAHETDDGDDTPRSGSRLLFTRGYSVFNAAQVDGYTPKSDPDTPIEQRIESAEQFFSHINARVVNQGNRAFYSPDS